MVGRRAEQEPLRRALDLAMAGRGTVVLIAGEAGIGKSTLCAALAEDAGALGAEVRWGHCSEIPGAPPFWPWRQAVGGWPEVDVESDRFSLFESVVRRIVEAAGTGAVVVVVEDLHWADEDSLGLFAHLAAVVPSHRIVLVATYRPGEVAPGGTLDRTVATIATKGHVVELGGLSLAEVEALVRLHHGGAVSDDALAAIADHTNGNPFFVAQVVRLLAADGRLQQPGGRLGEIPHTVRSVVRRRVAALDEPDAGDVLSIAAAIGRSFDVRLLGTAAPGLAVAAALDAATRSGLLVDDDRPGTLRFVHALVREVLETEPGGRSTAETHARLLELLEDQGDDSPEPTAARARHALAAASLLDPGAVAEHVHRAAVTAFAAGGFEEAVRLCEVSMDLLPESDPRRYDAMLLLGRARFSLDDLEGSEHVLLDAASLSRSLGDVERQARALLEVGSGRLVLRFGDSLPTQLLDLLAEIDESDSALRALVQSRYADLVDDPAVVEAAAREAYLTAVRSGTAHAIVQAGARLLLNGAAWMPMPERRAVVDTMRAAVRSGAPADLLINTGAMECRVLLEEGRLDEATAVARSIDDGFGRLSILLHLGDPTNAVVALLRGDLVEADRLDRANAAEAGRRGATAAFAATLAARRSAIAREQDAGESMLPSMEVLRRSGFPSTGGVLAPEVLDITVALVLAETGQSDRAEGIIDVVLASDLERLAKGWGGNEMGMMCLLVDALEVLGRRDGAERLGRIVEAVADRNVVVGMPPTFALGHGSYFSGVCDRLAGRTDRAATRLEEARRANEAMRAVTPLTRTHLALASLEIDRGDGNDALRHVRRAHDLATGAGLPALARRASARLEELGPSSATSQPVRTTTFVFTDIVDSTSRTRRVGDRSWAAQVAAHTSTIRAMAARHRGRLVKGLGDGFMLTFAAARDAIDFAAAVQAEPATQDLVVRIGVHTGEAEQVDGDHIGHHVNYAARVAGAADGGEVLVSEVVYHVLSGQRDVAFGPPRHVDMKGIGREQVRPLLTDALRSR